MVSYNKVNGHPNTLSPHLHKLRELDPHLVIVTDAWGLSGVLQDYRHYDDPATAYHAAVRAGIDNFTEQPATATGALHEALAAGLLRSPTSTPRCAGCWRCASASGTWSRVRGPRTGS